MSGDTLVLQFSTAAPLWKRWVPKFARRPKAMCLIGDENWGSSLIRRTNHSPFSHVDIVLEDGNLLGASNNPVAPTVDQYPLSNAAGVAVRPPCYQAFRYRRQMVIVTPRAADVRLLALTQLGKGFDNGSLKEFISDSFPGERDWRLDDHWFCAELVVWAMEAANIFDGDISWPKNRVSPTDILLLMLTDRRWVNKATFWQPIPGLTLGPNEK